MFTCSHCSFQDGFKWRVDEHMSVKHGIRTDMTPRGKIPFPSTKLRVGPVGGGKAIKISTKVSVPPIRRHGMQSGLGVEYENSESEHGDTDEEAVDEEEHDEEMDEATEQDEETADEEIEQEDDTDMDEDEEKETDDEEEDDDNYLLYLINDIGEMYEYCIKLKRAYRKALKNLNDLNENDRKEVIERYATLEVKIKDDQFGIENENVECGNDDFWDFVFEFRDKLDEDMKLLENYVAVEKEKVLAKKNMDVHLDLKEIIKNALDLKKDFHKQGEECFESCSNSHIHSVAGLTEYFNDPEIDGKIRDFNPDKYDLIRKLTEPYNTSMGKIGDTNVTLHEKRKLMQKTNVGKSVIRIIDDLILPYMSNSK